MNNVLVAVLVVMIVVVAVGGFFMGSQLMPRYVTRTSTVTVTRSVTTTQGLTESSTVTKTATETITQTSTVAKTLTVTETKTTTRLMTYTLTKTETSPVYLTVTETITKTVTPKLKEGEWNFVMSVSGIFSKVTDTFHIHSSKWRINWSYDGESAALFMFKVYRVGGSSPIYMFGATNEGKNSDTTYVYVGPGEFYLDITAVGVKNWNITIEEWIPGKT